MTSRSVKTGAGFTPSFTLLELLIVIGIIAVLGSVTFIALNPVETIRASRDTQRFSDLDALNKAVNMAVIENTSASLGTASTVYVSLPDASSTCASWSLPSLPTGWAYHCAASSTYTLTNGTGWLPVNLASLSTGSPIAHDPLDPTNDATHYYQYVPNPSQTTWELASVMESAKYKMGGPNDKTSTDGGQNLGLYEKGTDLTLVPVDSGDQSLVGWWPLNEGSGTVAYDRSGKGNNGNWGGTPAGDNGTYYTTSNGKTVGKFDGSDDIINLSGLNVNTVATGAQTSVSFWMYWNGAIWKMPFGFSGYDLITNTSTFGFNTANSDMYGMSSAPSINNWVHVVAIFTNGDVHSNKLYINSVQQSLSQVLNTPRTANVSAIASIAQWPGGSGYFFGSMLRDVHIYNRALSAQEIQAIYNATK